MDIKPEQVKALLIGELLEAKEAGLSEQPSCPYRDELERKSYSELWTLYEQIRPVREKQQQEKRRVEDGQRMRDIAKRWARKPYWTKHETVALLLRLDPQDCVSHSGRGAFLSVPSHLEHDADDLEDLIGRAITAKKLPSQMSPSVLIGWLQQLKVVIPPELLDSMKPYMAVAVPEQPLQASKVVDDDGSCDEPESTVKGTIINRRIQAICIAIAAKGWDALSIPERGKKELEKICLTERALFSESTFESAWKEARARNVVKTEKHETYAKREKKNSIKPG